MKPANPKPPTIMNHFIRVRLSKSIVADIDYVISKASALEGFSRSKFIRAAVRYALDSLQEDGYVRGGRAAPESHRRAARK